MTLLLYMGEGADEKLANSAMFFAHSSAPSLDIMG